MIERRSFLPCDEKGKLKDGCSNEHRSVTRQSDATRRCQSRQCLSARWHFDGRVRAKTRERGAETENVDDADETATHSSNDVSLRKGTHSARHSVISER